MTVRGDAFRGGSVADARKAAITSRVRFTLLTAIVPNGFAFTELQSGRARKRFLRTAGVALAAAILL
jgi:hypothetical protein